MTWWENNKTADITYTFLPAIHWSNRGAFDLNNYLWGSWMIQTNDGFALYFAGDSAYGNHFKQIGSIFPIINVALMPIGPEQPHTFTQSSHMCAKEAVEAFTDLGAINFIPMHWGTFRLGTDSFIDPINSLLDAWKSLATNAQKQLTLAKFGQAIMPANANK